MSANSAIAWIEPGRALSELFVIINPFTGPLGPEARERWNPFVSTVRLYSFIDSRQLMLAATTRVLELPQADAIRVHRR